MAFVKSGILSQLPFCQRLRFWYVIQPFARNQPAELNVTLKSGASSDISSIEWFPATGLSRTDVFNPVVITDETRTYYVKVTNINGCSTEDSLTVKVIPKEKITVSFAPGISEISPGESVSITLRVLSENSAEGITSFKAKVLYDNSVFQFTDGKTSFLKGGDNSWTISLKRTAPSEATIEAAGVTPIVDFEIALQLTGYLGKQTDENIVVKLNEVNGESTESLLSCRKIESTGISMVLKDVCAGDLRLVNLGKYKTLLQQVSPHPVSDEEATIHYTVGIAGRSYHHSL